MEKDKKELPRRMYFVSQELEIPRIIKRGVKAVNGEPIHLYCQIPTCMKDGKGKMALFGAELSNLLNKTEIHVKFISADEAVTNKIPARCIDLVNGSVSERYFSVHGAGKSRLYDMSGRLIFEGSYAGIEIMSNRIVCCLKDEGGFQFYDPVRNLLSDIYAAYYGFAYWGGVWQYSSSHTITQRLCLVQNHDGKFGLFDLVDFRQCGECRYEDILPFGRDDYFSAKRDGLWTILRSDGHEMFPPAYVRLGKWFYCNEKGPYLISAYDGEKYGYINACGVVKIPFRYCYADDFKDGLARVCIPNGLDGNGYPDSYCFHIDTHGNPVPMPD